MTDFKNGLSNMIGMNFGQFYPSWDSLGWKYNEETSKTVNGFDYKDKQGRFVASVDKHVNEDGSVTLSIYDNITKRKYSTQPYKNGYHTDNTPFIEIRTDKYVIHDTNKNKKVDKTDIITILETGQELTLGEYLDAET